MARLIVKIKYMKPNSDRDLGKYAKYIATREGVQKIDESAKFHAVTTSQKELIAKILKIHPESRESLEYEDYLKDPTISNASEFITRTLEEHYESELDQKTYADYIATRPRAERIGRHGLFTDDGVEVDLKAVSQELKEFEGTIWTAIISMRREDAERLGFDKGARWRDMVRAHTDEIAKNFGIKHSDLKWYGAFHDESYHPHIHLIIYDKSNNAYLDKNGIETLKSTFAHAIFKDEMFFVQNEKSQRRNELRLRGREEIYEIIDRIKEEATGNKTIEWLMIDLAERLRSHEGRKVYGYLKKEDKSLVNTIIDEIGKIPAVAECYDLWYEKQEELSRFYKTNMPLRLPLSANPEFKVLKNAVIRAASEIDPDEIEDLADRICASENAKRVVEERDQDHKPIQNTPDAISIGLSISRLFNNVTRIFKSQFKDNPTNSPRVDRKLKRAIHEKEISHGIEH